MVPSSLYTYIIIYTASCLMYLFHLITLYSRGPSNLESYSILFALCNNTRCSRSPPLLYLGIVMGLCSLHTTTSMCLLRGWSLRHALYAPCLLIGTRVLFGYYFTHSAAANRWGVCSLSAHLNSLSPSLFSLPTHGVISPLTPFFISSILSNSISSSLHVSITTVDPTTSHDI